MEIAIFGLGYVGAVTAALLAERGNSVVGVDINPIKSDAIRAGETPVLEPQLGGIITSTVRNGSLTAVSDPAQAGNWKVAFVCVGTPSAAGGQLDPKALKAVLMQLGQQVKGRTDYPVIVIRSTVEPRCLKDIVIPEITQSAG